MDEIRIGIAFAGVILVAVVFLVSGISKLRGGTFASDLSRYQLLPKVMIRPVARTLPWVEVAVGFLLLTWTGSRIPILLGLSLLVAFTIAVTATMLRGLRVACGCRANGAQVSWRLVGTNLCLIAIASTGAVADPPTTSLVTAVTTGMSARIELPALVALVLLATLSRLTSVWVKVLRRTKPRRAVTKPVGQAAHLELAAQP